MRLSISQDVLASALGIAGRFVSTRSTLPVMSHVLLSADADTNRMTVRGTDLATAASVTVPCTELLEPGEMCLPARLLTELVRNLPNDGDEGIEIEEHGSPAVITSGRFQSKILSIQADEFPIIPLVLPTADVELDADQFQRMVGRTVFAAANNLGRPTMCGVLTVIDGETLTMAATDGYRLAVASEHIGQEVPSASAIIPAAALREAMRVAIDAEPMRIGLDANRATFSCHGVTITAQLIEAKYPDYKAIMPAGGTTIVTTDVASLAHALKVGDLFTDKARRIVLSIEDGSLRVQSQAAETGDTDIELPAETDGPALAIAFNAAYLREVLAVLGTGLVIMRFRDANRPVLIRPMSVGGDEDGSYTHVLMPMSMTGR